MLQLGHQNKEMKMKIIDLRGTSKEIGHLKYLYGDDLYIVTRPSCGAEAHELIAKYLKVSYDGIFLTDLYSQNTVKFKKNWLKALGYKVSGLNGVQVDELIVVRFLRHEANGKA